MPSVLQLMSPVIPPSVGWPIIGMLVILAGIFFVKGIRKKDYERNDKEVSSNRKEAYAIHQKIVELDVKLWTIKDSLPESEDLQHNPDIIRILNDLHIELNKLGQIVDSRKFDDWAEVWMKIYSKFLKYHMDVRDEIGAWSRERINSNLRRFINQEVKD